MKGLFTRQRKIFYAFEVLTVEKVSSSAATTLVLAYEITSAWLNVLVAHVVQCSPPNA